MEEEEISRKYDEGALPLVAMPLLLHAHLLVQGQGFRRRQFQQFGVGHPIVVGRDVFRTVRDEDDVLPR